MALSAESPFAALPSVFRKPLERVRDSAVGARLARGVLWSLAGAIGSRGLTLVSYVIVARLLGASGFGEFSAVQSTIATILVMAGLGLGLTATKYVAELRGGEPAKVARMIALCESAGLVAGGIMTLFVVILAMPIASNVLAAPHLSLPLQLGAVMILFSTMASIQSGALSGFEAFDTIAQINLISGPVGLVAVASGAYRYGLSGAIVGLAVTQAVIWALNRRALTRRSPELGRFRFVWPTFAEWETLYKYSAPVLLISLIVVFSNWLSIAALVHQRDGYTEMGVFGAANQWLIALMVLPTIIGQVVFPHATAVLKNGYAASLRLTRHATAVSAAVTLPIVVVGCLASPLIMRAYGSGFGDSAVTLAVVLVTAGVLAVQTPAVQVIAAAGRVWALLLTYVVWSAIFVAGSFFAVRWGAIGLATARLLAYLIHSAAIYWTARNALKSTEVGMESAIASPGA